MTRESDSPSTASKRPVPRRSSPSTTATTGAGRPRFAYATRSSRLAALPL